MYTPNCENIVKHRNTTKTSNNGTRLLTKPANIISFSFSFVIYCKQRISNWIMDFFLANKSLFPSVNFQRKDPFLWLSGQIRTHEIGFKTFFCTFFHQISEKNHKFQNKYVIFFGFSESFRIVFKYQNFQTLSIIQTPTSTSSEFSEITKAHVITTDHFASSRFLHVFFHSSLVDFFLDYCRTIG